MFSTLLVLTYGMIQRTPHLCIKRIWSLNGYGPYLGIEKEVLIGARTCVFCHPSSLLLGAKKKERKSESVCEEPDYTRIFQK